MLPVRDKGSGRRVARSSLFAALFAALLIAIHFENTTLYGYIPETSTADEVIPIEMDVTTTTTTMESDGSLAWPGRELKRLNMTREDALVLVIVSCPYLDMADNALASMRRNANMTNVAVVPLDDISRDVLRASGVVAAVLDVPPFAKPPPLQWKNKTKTMGAPKFGSDQFRELVSTRPQILKAVLENLRDAYGVDDAPSLFYSDIDTYFLADPIPFFRESATNLGFRPPRGTGPLDIHPPDGGAFDVVALMDETFESGNVCSCFVYVRPTRRALNLLDAWTDASRNLQNQAALSHVIFWDNATTTSLRLYDDANAYVHSGVRNKHKNPNNHRRQDLLVVHNNFLSGHDRKVRRFRRQWDMWHPSGDLEQFEYDCAVPGVVKYNNK